MCARCLYGIIDTVVVVIGATGGINIVAVIDAVAITIVAGDLGLATVIQTIVVCIGIDVVGRAVKVGIDS